LVDREFGVAQVGFGILDALSAGLYGALLG
jgi:hypothetical protein